MDAIQIIRARRILLIAMLINLLAAFGGEGFYRLWALHTITNMTLPNIGGLQPVVWTNIMEGGGTALTLAATYIFAFIVVARQT